MALMLQDALDTPPAQPGIDPSLLAQIMALGSVDQRHKLLQQQGALGAQTAEGAPIDYRHGKGTPLLLAGLANLASAGVGGYQQGKAMAGERGLLDEQTKGRAAAASALTSAAPPDLQSLLTAAPGQPTTAAAGRVQDAIQRERQGGLLALLSGDPTLAGAGKAVYGDAERAQETALGMPEKRLGLQAAQRAADVETSPVLAAADRDLAQKYGVTIPDGTSPGVAHQILTGAVKKYEEDTKRLQVPKVASDAYGRYDARTGAPISGSPTAVDLLTPEAIDQQARNYIQTGILPSMGKANPLIHGLIIKRAAELSGGGSLAEGKASYGADTSSLKKAQVQADSIDAFENTALKNLDNFLNTAGSVIDTGSPLFNKPLRSLDAKVLGDVNTAKFNTARQVAVQEIGKVLGGAVSGGVISDSQRHEVESLLGGDMSLAQIKATADVLKQDMANRKSAVQQQIANIRGRLSGKPAEVAPAAPAAPTHYLISPDRKQRIPADDKGNPLGPPEPNPNG